MGFLSKYSGTVRVNITEPNDESGYWWVELKRTLSGAELDIAEGKKLQISATGTDSAEAAKVARQRARQAALGLPVEEEEAPATQTNVRIDTAAYRLELLTLAVVNWNLTDELDRLLPLAPQGDKRRALKMLPPDVYDLLVARVEAAAEEVKKTPSKDEQADFRPAGDSGGAFEAD